MRCMVCGAAMHLIEVQPAESTMGPGFEHHAFECSGCRDTEQRLVFRPLGTPRPVPMAVHPAVSSAVASAAHDADYALLKNAWEMLRGWRKSP
jgi:hypothetical protein